MTTSQHDRIIAYMKDHGGISVLEAAKELNIFYLPRRICDLEARGIKIKRSDKKIINASGKLTTITIYSLLPQADKNISEKKITTSDFSYSKEKSLNIGSKKRYEQMKLFN